MKEITESRKIQTTRGMLLGAAMHFTSIGFIYVGNEESPRYATDLALALRMLDNAAKSYVEAMQE